MEENYEMPTPCIHCGEIFDLDEGYGSEKWHKDIIICKKCHDAEEQEIENDERWETINAEVSDALYELKEEGAWQKLTKENRELIMNSIFPPLPMVVKNMYIEGYTAIEMQITSIYNSIQDYENIIQMKSATDFKKEWLNEPNHCPVLTYPTAPLPTSLIELTETIKKNKRTKYI